MPLTSAQANYILRNKLGCCFNFPNERIAYGFGDIEGDGEHGGTVPPQADVIIAWAQNPNQPPFEPRWHDRLWNTCGFIIAMNGSGVLSLVTQATAVFERRHFDDPLARGDQFTFRRHHALPGNSVAVGAIPFVVDQGTRLGNVNRANLVQLYDAVLNELQRLAP